MTLWRDHMPQGMVLKSDAFASNLAAPGNAFPLERFYQESGRSDYSHIGLRVPLETLIEYGLEFQRRYVGGVNEAQVVRINRSEGGFNLVLDNGEQASAEAVVVAAGPLALREIPEALAPLPDHVLWHSSGLNDPSVLAGRRVTVVGAGQSALESAALLHEQGAVVTVLTRRPLFWYNPEDEDDPSVARSVWQRARRPNFGLGPGWRTWFWSEAPQAFARLPASIRRPKAYSTFGPAGSGWLKSRVDGRVQVHVGDLRSAEMRAGEVRLTVTSQAGPTTLAADHVIAATGYKPDLRRLPFLEGLHDEIRTINGAPELRHGFESSIPGLHFIGYLSAASFGPSMRFIYGTAFAAPRVASALSALRAGRQSRYRFTPRRLA